jgi:hypothetical protein
MRAAVSFVRLVCEGQLGGGVLEEGPDFSRSTSAECRSRYLTSQIVFSQSLDCGAVTSYSAWALNAAVGFSPAGIWRLEKGNGCHDRFSPRKYISGVEIDMSKKYEAA